MEKKKTYREIAKVSNPCECWACSHTFSRIIVHHMDGNHENNDERNLIKICEKCHHLIHWGCRKQHGDMEVMRRVGSLRKFLLKKKGFKIPSPKEDLTIQAIQPIYM